MTEPMVESRHGRARKRRVAALCAIGLVVACYVVMAQGDGANQNAHYALIRALAEGSPNVDATHLQVRQYGAGDFSYINGHYYAAKSPGLALATLPAYIVLKSAGAAPPYTDGTRQLWYLGLWSVVLPAAILLLLVYFMADRIEPGFGAVAAVTLGLASMTLPFSTLFFAHSLSSSLIFASFFCLWKERRGPPRLSLLAGGGLLAGLAATVEFPAAVLGFLLLFYAIARSGRLSRAVAYTAGTIAGGLPTLLFNEWAFRAPFKFSYGGVLTAPGANTAGFYGVTLPSFHVVVELLFARIGLLTLTPVVALGVVGAVLLYRKGQHAEALVIAGLPIVYLVFDSSVNGPFGGASPGPRYLVPSMPFLAIGLASAYRRFPFTTTALALGSATQMIVLTLSHPMSAPYVSWFHDFAQGDFTETSLSFIGEQRFGIALFVVLAALAVGAAIRATAKPRFAGRDVVAGVLVLPGWVLLVTHTPALLDGTKLGSGATTALLVATAVAFLTAVVPHLAADWLAWPKAPRTEDR